MERQRSPLRRHLTLSHTSETEPFSTTPGRSPAIPQRNRASHGQNLLDQIDKLKPLAEQAKRLQEQAGIAQGLGLQIQFSSFPDVELAIQSLSNLRQGIELRNVRHDEHHTYATVFVPYGKLDFFEKKLADYLAEKKTSNGKARDHATLINAIMEIRVAAFHELWTDDDAVLPQEGEAIWWEVWLPASEDRKAAVDAFRRIASHIGFEFAPQQDNKDKNVLHFPDRMVLLMRGTRQQITQSIMLLNNIAELRRAKETATFFDNLTPAEQGEWAEELLSRTQFPASDSPYICILDTGVNAGHPLLERLLALDDMHSIEPVWGVDDREGHGTEMAGLAIWGDLTDCLQSSHSISITHRLESVKLLSRNGGNAGRHFGNITIEAISRPEITAPHRRRLFNMAVTTNDNRDRGRPSAWSATLDRLACDIEGEGLTPRLIIVSAGNIDDERAWQTYPDSNSSDGIHDPGQAWNILTVGAYTQKNKITDEDTEHFQPVAKSGGLGPFSTTSMTWKSKNQKWKWPLKPDVVFEGGNAGIDKTSGEISDKLSSLRLLTTYCQKLYSKLFTTTNATSAATALCSRMAAQLMAHYPHFWPETIRALIIHSAEWTPQMQADFLDAKKRKGDYEELVRHCGFGVPNLQRALWSVSNSLTLIVQDELQPFKGEKGKEPTLCDMHLHRLPWPHEELMSLGETSVKLRVTLSYFIAPSPGIVERGGGGRYRYESHGLRFEVKRPAEALTDFRRRINKRAENEEEGIYTGGGSDSGWHLGPNLRHLGSLHSDIWEGTAADLAERGILAVYPVTGWWKTRQKLAHYNSKVRYALLVSIHAPETELDLYGAIENQVTVSLAVA